VSQPKFTVVKTLHQQKFFLPVYDETVDHQGDVLLGSFFAESVHQDKYNGCLFVVETCAQEDADEVI